MTNSIADRFKEFGFTPEQFHGELDEMLETVQNIYALEDAYICRDDWYELNTYQDSSMELATACGVCFLTALHIGKHVGIDDNSLLQTYYRVGGWRADLINDLCYSYKSFELFGVWQDRPAHKNNLAYIIIGLSDTHKMSPEDIIATLKSLYPLEG